MGKAMKAKSETVWIGCVKDGPDKGQAALRTCRHTKKQCVAACRFFWDHRFTATLYRLTPIKPRGKRKGKR